MQYLAAAMQQYVVACKILLLHSKSLCFIGVLEKGVRRNNCNNCSFRFFWFAITTCCISVVGVRRRLCSVMQALPEWEGETEHTAGWLAIEARVPEVEAESVQVAREQGRQGAEGQPQSQGLR